MNTDKKVFFFLKDSKQNKSTEKNVDANKIKAIRRKQVATARKRKMMKNNVKRNGAMEKKKKIMIADKVKLENLKSKSTKVIPTSD